MTKYYQLVDNIDDEIERILRNQRKSTIKLDNEPKPLEDQFIDPMPDDVNCYYFRPSDISDYEFSRENLSIKQRLSKLIDYYRLD